MGRKILFDGKIIFRDNIKISIDSPALNYGYGLFETILYENKKIFFLEDHLDRLSNSCKKLNIPLPNTDLLNKNITLLLIKENGFADNTVKIKIIYSPVYDIEKWNIAVILTQYHRNTRKLHATVNNKPRNNDIYRHKTLSFMQNKHLLSTIKDYDEVLFINEQNNIIEGTITNVIAVKNNVLYFTDDKNPYLFGIMQQNLIKDFKLFGFKKIQAVDEGFSKEFLKSCDEVLLMNSLKIASNVKSITYENDVIEYQSCKIASIIRDHYLKILHH